MMNNAAVGFMGCVLIAAYFIINRGGSVTYKARGLRNNNPLNIRQSDVNKWDGEVGADSDGFSIFSSELYGIRAAAKIVDRYKLRGIVTLSQIIATWAPPTENDTDSYIQSVSKKTGIAPDAIINRGDYATLFYQMIYHENGVQPYTEQTIIDGVNLA